jgi:hypothetical protein
VDSNAKAPSPMDSIAGKTKLKAELKTTEAKTSTLDDFSDLEDLDSNFDDDLYAGL